MLGGPAAVVTPVPRAVGLHGVRARSTTSSAAAMTAGRWLTDEDGVPAAA